MLEFHFRTGSNRFSSELCSELVFEVSSTSSVRSDSFRFMEPKLNRLSCFHPNCPPQLLDHQF
jgi:hypothetical protein